MSSKKSSIGTTEMHNLTLGRDQRMQHSLQVKTQLTLRTECKYLVSSDCKILRACYSKTICINSLLWVVHRASYKINMLNTIHNLTFSPFLCCSYSTIHIQLSFWNSLYIFNNIANYYIFFTIYNFRYCYWWYLWPGSSVCSSSNTLHSAKKVD